jgi:intergrase/recombinase
LLNNKSEIHAKYTFKSSKKNHHLAFSNELIFMKQSRKKLDILKGIANLTRFLDIINDTEFHEEFTKWLKKKEIKWRLNVNSKNYWMANNISIEKIVENLEKITKKYRIFGLFVLVSGLRTSEAIDAFNNHDKICRDGILEIFTDRNTKKTNAVYCHPFLHKEIKFKVTNTGVYRNLNSKYLGSEIRYLRKLNYTMVATKIDPLLAEFMQGRRGNVSQRHYFLPMMNQNKEKWIKIWKPLVE